jgi:hypothetical protein
METVDAGTGAPPTQAQLIAALNAKLLREQNLPLAIVAAAVSAVIGSALWMGITVATQMHLGLVALAVGAGIGYAVRYAGKGVTKIYGVIGAVFTLLSCLAGEITAGMATVASRHGIDFFTVLTEIDLGKLTEAILENTSPIGYLIYGIGIYEGYKFSFRRLTPQELEQAGLSQTPTVSPTS